MKVDYISNSVVELRPYDKTHVAKTVKWLQSPNIQENFGYVPDLTEEKHQIWLENNPEVLIWAIHAPDYVGNVLLFPNKKHYSAYLQIYIGDEHQVGRGIGLNAMQLLLDFAFTQCNFNRIWLHCLPGNTAAIKLYEKLKFHYEGTERCSSLYQGNFRDMGRWSLLRSDWKEGSAIL